MSDVGARRTYLELLTTPHLVGMLAWSLAGRLHIASTAIALTFLLAGWTGSYAKAGVVAGVLAVGQAIGGPWRGRLADRNPPAALVTVSSVVYSAGLCAIAAAATLLPESVWPVAAVIAIATGLFFPPVGPVARSSWPRMVPPRLRDSVYTLEATAQETIFIVGPTLVAVAIAVIGPTAALLLVAGYALIGGVGFAGMLRRAGLNRPATPEADSEDGAEDGPEDGAVAPARRRGGVLTARGVAALVAISGLVVGGLIAVELVLVAWGRDRGDPLAAGILLAVWSAGSALGGLIAVARPAVRPRLVRRLFAVLAGLVVLPAVLPPLFDAPAILIGVLLFVGGTAVAPALAAINGRLADVAPPAQRAEAYGWQNSAITASSAAVPPVTGACLDAVGPGAGAGVAVALGIGCVLVATGVPDRQPQR